jgi:hypothetical protein
MQSVDKLFVLVDFVEKLTLTGGEPLLNKELSKLIDYLCQYRNKIGFVEIITNGTIIPNGTLIIACQRFANIEFLVDDYGPDVSTKASETVRLILNHEIKVRRRNYYGDNAHLGGWVDFGDLSHKHDDTAAAELYRNCAYSRSDNLCYGIYGGKVSQCSVSRRCAEQDITSHDNILDLFCDNQTADNKKLWFTQTRDKLDACNYCNGMCLYSQRYSAAEQI